MFPKKDHDYLFHTFSPCSHPTPKTDYSVFKNRKCGCVNKENNSKLLPTDSCSQSLFMSFVDPFEKHHFSKVKSFQGKVYLLKLKGSPAKKF